MSYPVFVGAGTAVEIPSGTSTVSKTGCTADNLLLWVVLVRGATIDYSTSAVTNIEKQDGTTGVYSTVIANAGVGVAQASKYEFFIGRVSANGTCSVDYTVGASGNDLLVQFYEFSGVALGANQGAGTIENDTGTESHGPEDGTTITDEAVVTNGLERLACNFLVLDTNQTPGAITGMTGGTWAVAATAPTATGTLQLQTATIATAGTINGGSVTVTSTAVARIGLALIPAVLGTPGRTYKRLYGPAQLTDSAADLYTCPASTITRTLHIHASNPSGSPVDVNLSIGADASATRVWDDLAIKADSVKDVFDPYELTAGEKIQGWADTAGTVVVAITGYEDPV